MKKETWQLPQSVCTLSEHLEWCVWSIRVACFPLRACSGLRWQRGRQENMEKRACSDSRNHALFPWRSRRPSLSLDRWSVLALCPQEDGGAAAAHAPTLEELYSEGECRPKDRWPLSSQSPGKVLKGEHLWMSPGWSFLL